jgi:hypothetical protein
MGCGYFEVSTGTKRIPISSKGEKIRALLKK